jgi:L-ascorbate metabolism protein UlaG (beta-lactamase superfamily)
MKVTYYSHAFVEIETSAWSILIDPFIIWNPTIKIGLDKILQKNILAVVLTHGHNDHIWDGEEICKRTGAKLIATFELAQYFINEISLKNVHAMHIWGEFNFWDFSVKFTPAVHGWGIADLKNWYTTFPAWVIIRVEWKNIYHAWDTGLTYDMKLLWDYDTIDLAFLPIWWNFTMWIDDAVIAVKDFIKPKKVIPIHYNTWGIIKSNPNEFVEKLQKTWFTWEVLDYGDSLEL